jgi:hypothetical protein
VAQAPQDLRQVIETLKQQRVRQSDFKPVLDCVLDQARVLRGLSAAGQVPLIALHMEARARQLIRIRNSVRKFFVDDFLAESIAHLERAHKEQQRTATSGDALSR